MLRHISILSLRDGVTRAAAEDAVAQYRRLTSEVDGLVACAPGLGLHLGDGQLAAELGIAAAMGDLAIVLDFEDRKSWDAYARGPVRRRLVQEVLLPIVAERRAIQYEI